MAQKLIISHPPIISTDISVVAAASNEDLSVAGANLTRFTL
ncbi:MAG: hypothetical protein ACI9PP_002056 [Halobacteriales archaeon]|jgi:hypothetical protein